MFIRVKNILINMDNVTNIMILDAYIEFAFAEGGHISLRRKTDADGDWDLTPDEFDILKKFLDDNLEQYKVI